MEVDIWNIPVQGFALFLLDEDFEVLQEVQSFGQSNIGFDYQIGPGTYFVEVGSIPTSNSWRFPYAYSLLFTPESGLIADFSSNIQEGCAPFTVNFFNQSEGTPTSYLWTFTGGNPGTANTPNPVVTYSQPGVYPVTLMVSNSTGNNTITKNGYITVKSAPEAGFSFELQQNNTVVFTNQTQFDSETPSYIWDFGDSQTSTDVSPTHTYSMNGMYTVELTAANSCGNSSTSKTVDIMAVSTNTAFQDAEILIFPNPAKNMLMVQVRSSDIGVYHLKILNNIGQVVKQEVINKTGELASAHLNISDLSVGVYIVQVQSGREIQMMKVVKE